MKRIIFSKFKSKCQETGKTINKGDTILYDPTIKRAYSEQSEEFRQFIREEQPRDWIQDPGEIDSDNFCQRNGI